MPFFDLLLAWQTGISQSDAEEAATYFSRCEEAARGSKKITDPHLCGKIYCNKILHEACKRRGFLSAWPTFGTVISTFLGTCLHLIVAVLLMPLGVIVSYYAQYRLNQMIENMRPLKKDGATDEQEEGSNSRTARDFITSAEIGKEIRNRSGSEAVFSYGGNNFLDSSYYNSLAHRITVPKCLAKSTTPEAKAIGGHECAHGEQRIFLLFKFIIYVAATVAAAIFLALMSSPILACVATIGLIVTAAIVASMPVVTALYEIDASKRALANLIAYGYITTEAHAARATYALQLAATTYIAAIVSSLPNLLRTN